MSESTGLDTHGLTLDAAPVRGMVLLRGRPDDLATIARDIIGVGWPGALSAALDDEGHGVLWMAPDEALLLVADHSTVGIVNRIGEALAGQPHLVADVSDARVAFRLSGTGWRDALAKLTPVDLRPAAFGPGDFRRTRLGQVAAAFWMAAPDAVDVICARSVAAYVRDSLTDAARPEAHVGHFSRARA